MGFERLALEQRAVREIFALDGSEELQDAGSGDHWRARLSRAVHTVVTVLHGAPKNERAVTPPRLPRRGTLAQLVRDGAVLHGAPRMVPQVLGRRRCSMDNRPVPSQ